MKDSSHLLAESNSVNVVLNGGSSELSDSTIPFSVGFTPEIAQKRPTHILVIDFTSTQAARLNVAYLGERRLYTLQQYQFIQFHSPGRHNLVFILLKDVTPETERVILQKQSLRSSYENPIHLKDIESGNISGFVGYCEKEIEVAEEFFSTIPKKGIRAHIWVWVNRWYKTLPVDQCEFRSRAMVAFTIQPIIWITGFLLRLIAGIVIYAVSILVFFVILLFGQQLEPLSIREYFENFILEFDSSYTFAPIGDMFDYKPKVAYKVIKLGKFKIGLPISLAGLCIQSFLWALSIGSLVVSVRELNGNFGTSFLQFILFLFLSLVSLWHAGFVFVYMPYKKVDSFVDKFPEGKLERKYLQVTLGYVVVMLMLFFITQIACHISEIVYFVIESWNSAGQWRLYIFVFVLLLTLLIFRKKSRRFLNLCGNNFEKFLDWVFSPLLSRLENKRRMKRRQTAYQRVQPEGKTVDKYQQWLLDTMDINTLPKKVEIKTVSAPSLSKAVVQKFSASFWLTKAKVCKPYAKP